MKASKGKLTVLLLETPHNPVLLGVFDDSEEGRRAKSEALKKMWKYSVVYYEADGLNKPRLPLK